MKRRDVSDLFQNKSLGGDIPIRLGCVLIIGEATWWELVRYT